MKHKKFLLALAIAVATILAQKGAASAATIDVSSSCSIDNAIISANNDADTGGCVGAGVYGDDTINIPAGTWVRTSAVTVMDNVVIQGAGVGQTIIDGDDTYGLLVCGDPNDDSNQFDFEIHDVTIQNNAASPTDDLASAIAILNCNSLLKNIEIRDWGSAGITILSTNSAVSATLEDIYIHDGAGFALRLASFEAAGAVLTADINRLTITKVAPVVGSGMPGFGIWAESAQGTINATISNATISNDTADDFMAVLAQATPKADSVPGHTSTVELIIRNSTIARNAMSSSFGFPANGVATYTQAEPGDTADASLSLQNTLLADNMNNSNCFEFLASGGGTEQSVITSLGNNLTDDTSCNLVASGDQQGVANLVDSLGPLQNNGGPIPTMALLTGSPAIDAGATVAGLTTDARGITRPQGSAYDIGAFEVEQTSTPDDDEDDEDDGNVGNDNDKSASGGVGNTSDTKGGPATPGALANTGDKIVLLSLLALTLLGTTAVLMKRQPRFVRYVLSRY